MVSIILNDISSYPWGRFFLPTFGKCLSNSSNAKTSFFLILKAVEFAEDWLATSRSVFPSSSITSMCAL